jgi:tRNA(Leu) C34 or U34 (ribose-2'-O)-methylase TrmL
MRGYSTIGLWHPKNENNMGSVMRAAHCYGSLMVALEGRRFKKGSTDTPKAWRNIPVIEGELNKLIPYDCVPVAVEITNKARSIINYVHPERAMYIFGPEDGSLPDEIISWCRDTIYVPTKECMNLAATVNVILYDRMRKNMV